MTDDTRAGCFDFSIKYQNIQNPYLNRTTPTGFKIDIEKFAETNRSLVMRGSSKRSLTQVSNGTFFPGNERRMDTVLGSRAARRTRLPALRS